MNNKRIIRKVYERRETFLYTINYQARFLLFIIEIVFAVLNFLLYNPVKKNKYERSHGIEFQPDYVKNIKDRLLIEVTEDLGDFGWIN